MIVDSQKRQFKKLRVSLLGNCNFACAYCVPDGNSKTTSSIPGTPVSIFLENILRIHKILSLESVRLTGGEPTLYKDLPELIYHLKKNGIPKVTLTTNGSRLSALHEKLKTAEIDSINVSLDSIENGIFKKINRSSKTASVLEGIDLALQSNINIKINCTLMKDYNENQILPILDWAMERNIPVRFLELMKMGHLVNDHEKYFYSQEEILKTIESKYTLIELGREKSNTCSYWQIPGGIKVGIISNHSKPFCTDCDRLRMDQFGNIYGCLSVNTSFPMEKDESLLKENLTKALALKRKDSFSGSSISMKAIGG